MARTIPHLSYFQVLPGVSYTLSAAVGSGQPGVVAAWLDQTQLANGVELVGLNLGEGAGLKGRVLTVNVQVVDANVAIPNVSAMVTLNGSGLSPVVMADVMPTQDGDQVLFNFSIHLV